MTGRVEVDEGHDPTGAEDGVHHPHDARLNRGSSVAEFIPGLILIGTDGGGEGIGLDLRGADSPVVLVNLDSLRWDEAMRSAPLCPVRQLDGVGMAS